MVNPKIEKFLVKHMAGQLSDNEKDELFRWLDIPHNRSLFKDYIQVSYAVNYNLNDVSANQFKNKLTMHIRKYFSFFKNRLKSVFQYVAFFGV